MTRWFRAVLTLSLAVGAIGYAGDALAQSTADAKRTLKAQKLFYKEPGFIEVDVRAMRATLMLTGYVPTEEHKAQADEIAGKIRGVRDIRNRIRVRDPEVAAGGDSELLAKLNAKIEEDDELELLRAKGKFELELEDGNVRLEGKLTDWADAGALIQAVRRVPGIKTINFEKLKY